MDMTSQYRYKRLTEQTIQTIHKSPRKSLPRKKITCAFHFGTPITMQGIELYIIYYLDVRHELKISKICLKVK